MNFFLQYVHTILPLKETISSMPLICQQQRHKHKIVDSKKHNNIPKSIREIIWYDFIKRPEPIEFCPCCQTRVLTPFTFEAGHIQSRKNGGGDTSSNLLPICRTCNMSMNSIDWTDYVKQYYGNERLQFDLNKFEKLNNFK